jgi:hypothetical protein
VRKGLSCTSAHTYRFMPVPDNSPGKDLYIMNLVHGLVWRDDKLLPKICLTNHRLHCRLRRIIEKCKKSVPAGLQFLPRSSLVKVKSDRDWRLTAVAREYASPVRTRMRGHHLNVEVSKSTCNRTLEPPVVVVIGIDPVSHIVLEEARVQELDK